MPNELIRIDAGTIGALIAAKEAAGYRSATAAIFEAICRSTSQPAPSPAGGHTHEIRPIAYRLQGIEATGGPQEAPAPAQAVGPSESRHRPAPPQEPSQGGSQC